MRPKIPQEEFVQRQQQVQLALQRQGCDLLIAYGDDRIVFGQAHTRWLFDYQPQFEPACGLVPAQGEASIMTGAESESFVLAHSHCRRVWVTDEFNHPDEEYLYTASTPMRRVMETQEEMLGKRIGKVAIAGLELLPQNLYAALCQQFGEENLVDGNPLMAELRSVKSQAELRVIRYAYQLAEQGLQAAVRAARPGVTEREIAAEAEYTMRRLGSEGMGIETMVASGRHNTHSILARTTNRKLRENDLVVFTIAPRYEGYHGAIARPMVLGKPDAQVIKAINLAVEAHEKTAAALKPGIMGKEVDRVARGIVDKAGMSKHFVYTAIHSVGVVEFEAPILASTCETVLQENMVFSVDIPLFLNEWGGLRVENGYQITKDGTQPLCILENRIEWECER